jgi:hypothetical protein
MAFTHTLVRAYRDSSGNSLTATESVTGDAENNYSAAWATGTVDGAIHLAFTQANIKSLCITSDQAVTLDTNAIHSGSPQDTISVAAGQVIIWSLATDLIGKCPFSGNVTEIYLQNSSGQTANVNIRSILNQ